MCSQELVSSPVCSAHMVGVVVMGVAMVGVVEVNSGHTILLLDECRALWGEPLRAVYM